MWVAIRTAKRVVVKDVAAVHSAGVDTGRFEWCISYFER